MLGIIFLLLRGLLTTIQLVQCRLMKEWGWPYFRMTAAVSFLAAVVTAVGLRIAGLAEPERQHWKWVLYRGLAGSLSFICAVLAAQVGAPLGDLEALRSVNIVSAALLGRLFLGERLGRQHFAALACSVAGALLISQPSVLTARTSPGAASGAADLAWLGYVLAPLSGLFQACVFVSSRKAAGTSIWVLTLWTYLISGVATGLLPFTPAVWDSTSALLVAAPWQAAFLLALLFGCTFLSTVMLSAASKWCTAAESAVVSTCAGMAFGYIAQTKLFGVVLEPLALSGAGLMLLAVVAMVMPSTEAPEPPEENGSASPMLSVEDPQEPDVGLEDECQMKRYSAASDASTTFSTVEAATDDEEDEALPILEAVL